MRTYNRFVLESMRPTVALQTKNGILHLLREYIAAVFRRLNRSG
ncbi:MAG: hypothetical protein RL007_1380 [Bacteroidota bacterium]|jgi:hypothetical protein